MTKDEKIQSLLNDGFVLTKGPYNQDFFIKYGEPNLIEETTLKKEDFLKYEILSAEIQEYERDNDGKIEKRYVICDKHDNLINKPLSKLKYFDRENRSLFAREEECINKFAEYGVNFEKGDIIASLGYVPNNEHVEYMMENAKEKIRDFNFAKGLKHELMECGQYRQAKALTVLFDRNDNEEIYGPDKEWSLPIGANWRHEDFIVNSFAIPVITALIEQEHENGRYLHSELVKIVGQNATDKNFEIYRDKLRLEQLTSKGLDEETAKNIFDRLKNGEQVENYDRIIKIKDAIKLSKDLEKTADSLHQPFDKEKFIETYVFTSGKQLNNSEKRIGTYEDLRDIADKPLNLYNHYLKTMFFEEFEKNKDISGAVAKVYKYKDLYFPNSRSEEERQEIINFWKDKFKMHTDSFTKDLSNEDTRKEVIEKSIDDFMDTMKNSFSWNREIFQENSDMSYAKNITYSILGENAFKDNGNREHGREYLYLLIGEQISKMPEFKELMEAFSRSLMKKIEYHKDWEENHPNVIAYVSKDGTEICRYFKPLDELRAFQEEAITFQDKVDALKKIENFNFYEYDKAEKLKTNIYDLLDYNEKTSLAKNEEYAKIFLKDPDPRIRVEMIERGYGLKECAEDKEPEVVAALIKTFGYENLIKYNVPDDRDGEVAYEIAIQGYKLDEYIESRTNPGIREIAKEWLQAHNLTLEEYIKEYPERCYYEKNRQLADKEIDYEKEFGYDKEFIVAVKHICESPIVERCFSAKSNRVDNAVSIIEMSNSYVKLCEEGGIAKAFNGSRFEDIEDEKIKHFSEILNRAPINDRSVILDSISYKILKDQKEMYEDIARGNIEDYSANRCFNLFATIDNQYSIFKSEMDKIPEVVNMSSSTLNKIFDKILTDEETKEKMVDYLARDEGQAYDILNKLSDKNYEIARSEMNDNSHSR